jgi:hypothetical protein
VYTPLLESRADELRVVYSTNGKEFTRAIENNLHYSGTQSTISVDKLHGNIESAPSITLINRGRAKSEGFTMGRLNMTSLHGESTRLVKVGIFPRRERTSRFGRMGGWQWIETGVILLDSKIIFVKGDLSMIKGFMNDSVDVDIIPSFSNEMVMDLVGCIALYDSNFSAFPGYILRLVSQYGESQVFSLSTEEDMNNWISTINYLAATYTALTPQESTSPAILRRRAGTMAPPIERSIPLRAISSTLDLRLRSKSEQSSSSSPPDKLQLYNTFQKQIEKKLDLQKATVDAQLRQARGLLIQTPIQDKTRIIVMNALERITKRLKTSRIEMERGLCYSDILNQLISIITGSKIRLVEAETEEFMLPHLGFSGHAKTSSDGTEDTMLSSTTLYTTLNPHEDIGVPIRRIGTPSLSISSAKKSTAENISEKNVAGDTVREKNGKTVMDAGPLIQLEKCESAPGVMDQRDHLNSSLAENIPSIKARDHIRVAEITRIVREGGF